MNAIIIRVLGEPKAQPRPRAFARKIGGKFVARVHEAHTAEEWKSLIAIAAKGLQPAKPFLGPVFVDCHFTFARPKRHFVGNNPAKKLRDDSPLWHTSKPDRDNLDKAVLDALTQIGGFWNDDCQVCSGILSKRYGDRAGVEIEIYRPISEEVGNGR